MRLKVHLAETALKVQFLARTKMPKYQIKQWVFMMTLANSISLKCKMKMNKTISKTQNTQKE